MAELRRLSKLDFPHDAHVEWVVVHPARADVVVVIFPDAEEQLLLSV